MADEYSDSDEECGGYGGMRFRGGAPTPKHLLPPAVSISDADRNDTTVKHIPIRSKAKYDTLKQNLFDALENITVPKLPQPTLTQHSNRGNIIGTIGRTLTFGFGDTRRGWNFYKTNKAYPEVFKALVEFGNAVVPKGFDYQGITVNHNVKAKKHIDGKNVGKSVIVGIGDFTGGEIRVWNEDDKNPRDWPLHDRPVMFNGGLLPHETQPFKGNRYTFVFYKQGRKPKGSNVGIGTGREPKGLPPVSPVGQGAIYG